MKVEPVVLELRSGGLTIRVEERAPGDLFVEAHVEHGSIDAVVAARSVDGRSVQASVRSLGAADPRAGLDVGSAVFDAPAGAGDAVESFRG